MTETQYISTKFITKNQIEIGKFEPLLYTEMASLSYRCIIIDKFEKCNKIFFFLTTRILVYCKLFIYI